MKNIPRHAVDPERVQEGIDRKSKLFADVLDTAADRASALSIVLGTAVDYAGFLAAAGAKSAELCHALRIGAQASAAIFTLGSGSGDIEFPLGDKCPRLPATGPNDTTHVGNWQTGWWLAHIVRDRAAIASLADTPIDVLRRSSSRGDACQYHFIEALQGFEKRAPDWSTTLQAALDATDPAQVKLSDEEFVLNILVPEMQLLFRLALGEIAPFTNALEFALARHKKYRSKGSRKHDPNGFIALGPLAIASIAFDAGVPIGVESDYLPSWLIENGCSKL